MLKIIPQDDIIEDFITDDFSFETTDYNKANDLAEDEVVKYYASHEFLNPYKKGDVVNLKVANRKRFSFIISPPNEQVKVGEIIGNNQVNVAMWDSYPSVIKNVSIDDISLLANNPFKVKMRNYLIRGIRALTPNWYINKPLKAYYKEFIDRLKIKKKNMFTSAILYLDSKLSK